MITTFLTIVAMADMAILGLLYFVVRQRSDGTEVLAEMTQERRLMAEMIAEAKEEIAMARHTARQTLNEVKHFAAEIEQEISNSKETIGGHMSEIIAELSQQVDKPLMELSQKQNALELLSRKLANEKQRLVELISKSEKICKFLGNEIPYEEILKDIEHKKYADARSLLARGLPEAQVAKELGLSLPELELLRFG